ncbi:ribosomal protein S7 [Pluteus cervinus]|uniref:Ribosomal protein S7 n=1 Tax=Pluteus cervinus TaxID=181527 RepID=A0ACD3AIF8_9AGAR|nr:ribosomal protein S7 [Pluteus cervinus]
MLPTTTRQALARIWPSYVRSLSTTTASHSRNPLSDAHTALGNTTIARKPPALPTLSTVNPSSINVPPAQDPLLHYLTSRLTTHGHRARAAKITSEVLLHIHAFTRAPPMPILREAILRASPAVRTLMHKHGGKMVAKPVALGEKQRTWYAMDWILNHSKKRTGQTVGERLARELIMIIEGKSPVLDEKERMHKFAMVNRGNAQTRV